MKFLILAALLLLCHLSTAAQSKDWKVLDITGDTKITGYYTYQPGTTIETNPHTFKTWLKHGDLQKRINKEMLVEMRCTKREFRVISLIVLSMRGRVLSVKSAPTSEWLDITPDSVNERLYTLTCEAFDG